MKKALVCIILFSISVVCPAGAAQPDSCTPGSTQRCICPDGEVKEQTCSPDGKSWAACDCTYYRAWCDNSTNLCWQDPQKDAYNESDDGVMPGDAVRYCRRLALGGYTDWRLPTIEELRSLIRGNPPTETGGECPMSNESVSADMTDAACAPATSYGGPGIDGCYWPASLTGSCNRPDPASQGHPLEYASASRCPDDPTKDWYGVVMFDNGAVSWNHINTLAEVRCVREAPTDVQACAAKGRCLPGDTRRCVTANLRLGAQICSDEGNCWGPCENAGFVESPPARDVCSSCDQITLTIRLPEALTVQPAQIMAFLYDAETWTFPPDRPPDGGNSDCQVKNPVIDVDTPFTLTVPACTYYRRQCLKGDYMLYVALMQTETMPPTMLAGDYWWGMEQEPITLGGNTGQEITMDITLVPWSE